MLQMKRLLIVDDEETLTFSLYQAFIRAPIDCEVITEARGDAAWERFREAPFDLVITDLAMPGLSGLELLHQIKQKRPQTRVLIITAYGSPENREEARRMGVDGFWEKPFDIFELRNTAIKLLG